MEMDIFFNTKAGRGLQSDSKHQLQKHFLSAVTV